jgi:hypothetical protein
MLSGIVNSDHLRLPRGYHRGLEHVRHTVNTHTRGRSTCDNLDLASTRSHMTCHVVLLEGGRFVPVALFTYEDVVLSL